MPRLSAIRTPSLIELLQQLRFAPSTALDRAVNRAEALAVELDPDGLYEVAWLVRRITGFEAEDSGASAPGDAILRDLSSFVERLGDMGAGPRFKDAEPPKFESVEGLCDRWNVSRRTLERWRRRGLIARRVRDDDGQPRLVFSGDIVAAFEHRNRAQLARARKFRRTPVVQRERLIRIASRARSRFGWSAAMCADQIAGKHGVPQRVARRIVEGARENGVRQSDPTRPLDARAGRVALRALERGVDPLLLAERWGKPARLVRRAADVTRLRRIESIAAHWPSDGGGSPDPIPAAALESEVDLTRSAPGGITAFLSWASSHGAPDRERERVLGACAVSMRVRVRRMLFEVSHGNPRPVDVERIEADTRTVWLALGLLLEDQSATVLRVLEDRVGGPVQRLGAPAAALLDTAFEAAAHATLRFDPSRGGRLAGRITLEVDKAAVAWQRDHGASEGSRASRALGAESLAPEALLNPSPSLGLLGEGVWISRVIGELPADRAEALRLRYGIGRAPRTIAELAAMRGESGRRTRSVLGEAVRAARLLVDGGVGAAASS